MNMFEKIKALCFENNVSVYKLEKDCDFSFGSISKWDKSFPKANSLAKVADYFNVSVDYLLGREQKTMTVVVNKEKELSQLQKKLLEYFDQLDEGMQYQAIGYVEMLADSMAQNLSTKYAK